MSTPTILKAIVAIAIIGVAILVILRDEPATPTGDINSIEPLPTQDQQ